MSTLLRLVFLACALTIVGVAAPAAQTTVRPTIIRIVVDGTTTITVDNGTPNSPDREKVWASAGGQVTFEIQNKDSVDHLVRIPIGQFDPSQKKEYGDDATRDPMVPNQKDSLTVKPGQVGKLVLKVKPFPHFGFDTRKWWKDDPHKDDPLQRRGMTYKYNIYTLPTGREEIHLDPDIEITRP